MFDKLLEKIQRGDEVESKLLSILEGKTWEQISLLRHLVQTRFTECVCHIYDLTDNELLEFYANTILNPEHYASAGAQKQLPEDRAEVQRELEKRGLGVNENGKKFCMVGDGVADSIKEFFDRKLAGRDEEYLINHARSRFGASKLADVLCNESISKSIDTLVRNELQNDPDISREELFQHVLDGVNDEVRDEAREILPGVYDDVISRYFESVNENLTDHAQRELELAGMFDKDVDGSEAAGSWNRLCAEAVMELMEVFAEQGHSGFSASMTQDLFSRLSKFEALTELTDNPDEWNDISEMQSGKPGWQSSRNPSCFSEDGGETYWDINEEYYLREDEENGMVYSGGLSTEEWKNRPMHQSKHFEKKE